MLVAKLCFLKNNAIIIYTTYYPDVYIHIFTGY